MTIEHTIARVAYEAERAYQREMGNNSQLPWHDVGFTIKAGVLQGVKDRIEKQPDTMHDLFTEHLTQSRQERLFNSIVDVLASELSINHHQEEVQNATRR